MANSVRELSGSGVNLRINPVAAGLQKRGRSTLSLGANLVFLEGQAEADEGFADQE